MKWLIANSGMADDWLEDPCSSFRISRVGFGDVFHLSSPNQSHRSQDKLIAMLLDHAEELPPPNFGEDAEATFLTEAGGWIGCGSNFAPKFGCGFVMVLKNGGPLASHFRSDSAEFLWLSAMGMHPSMLKQVQKNLWDHDAGRDYFIHRWSCFGCTYPTMVTYPFI